MSVDNLLTFLVTGLTLGGIYSLSALGLVGLAALVLLKWLL